MKALWQILIVIGVVAVVWGATGFMVPEETPRRQNERAERSWVTDGERAILALGAGLVTAGVLMARRNRE